MLEKKNKSKLHPEPDRFLCFLFLDEIDAPVAERCGGVSELVGRLRGRNRHNRPETRLRAITIIPPRVAR